MTARLLTGLALFATSYLAGLLLPGSPAASVLAGRAMRVLCRGTPLWSG